MQHTQVALKRPACYNDFFCNFTRLKLSLLTLDSLDTFDKNGFPKPNMSLAYCFVHNVCLVSGLLRLICQLGQYPLLNVNYEVYQNRCCKIQVVVYDTWHKAAGYPRC